MIFLEVLRELAIKAALIAAGMLAAWIALRIAITIHDRAADRR